MATPGPIVPDVGREPCNVIHRVTRENRHLWYQLSVIQQPERARACGAGTKANSDRRPVDPPPVVEMQIREGPSFEEGKDITFDYNANFFLYASLEQARKMAHGRMHAQPNPPILTGVPASGMAYLDRPSAAGYFIFPDLSVRHEGQYRLSFSLFETTKEEKDFDMDPIDNNLPPGVDWRMEIKTDPFDVFSAKKFPGLMESTQLSKDVAEQGCRVRIRRDVRMRKREGKSSRHSRRDDDMPRHRTVTPASEDPHAAAARARSLSNSSEHRVPYGPGPVPVPVPEPHRRPSSVVDAYAGPPLPPPPPDMSSSRPPSSSYDPSARGGHLSFGDMSAPQYAAPRGYAPVGPVSPSGPYTPTSQYVKPEMQSSAAYPPHSRGLPQPSPSPTIRPDGYDRGPIDAYVPPSPSVHSTDGHSRQDSRSSYPPTPAPLHHAPRPAPNPVQLAPLKIQHLVSPSPHIEPQTEPLPEPLPVPTGGKRKHELVFSQSAQPLHNHQRQLDPHYGGSRRGLTPEPHIGAYWRADGTLAHVPFNKCT